MLGSEMKKTTSVGPVAGQRSKVALQPGRSLMDWIRLGTSGKDLQGFGGEKRTVTMAELQKHNKEGDCWMLLRGKVYNVTAYLEYHPGGIPELMKGAGQDGTKFFDEVHKWVNIESMLNKCLIGPIEDNAALKKKDNGLPLALLLEPASKMFVDHQANSTDSKTKTMPRYEWYQDDKTVTLVIYTKSKEITENELLVDCSDGKTLNCKVLFPEKYYQVHLGREECLGDVNSFKAMIELFWRSEVPMRTDVPHFALQNDICGIKVSPPINSSGKFELILNKAENGLKWTSIGEKLGYNGQLLDEKDRELVYHQGTVDSITQITSNTKLFSIKLPDNVYYNAPIGHHIILEADVQGMRVGKNYTVMLESLDKEKRTCDEDSQAIKLNLMIKIYDDGALTPTLNQLQIGDTISVSECTGNFQLSTLRNTETVIMIAAGTGLTPMIRIMDYIIYDESVKRKGHLLFSNRYESDILWRGELDWIKTEHRDRIQIQYILSKPTDDWNGHKGRIDKTILEDFLSDIDKPTAEEKLLFCICGPDEFTEQMKRFLIVLGFPETMFHCFLG